MEIVDLRVDPGRMKELIEVSGQTKTPTLTHGDFLVADFDLEEFETALGQNPDAQANLGL